MTGSDGVGSGVVQLQVAAGSAALADGLVDALLDRRLIACGQRIGPMTSRFAWRGRRESTEEWLVLLKTTRELVERVVEAVETLHPDEVPEVLVVPVVGGSPGYLEWVRQEVSPDAGG